MLNLKIITPKKLVYEKDILSLTAPTVVGEITILPRHSSLLSLLQEGVIIIKSDKEIEYLSIGGGYLETDGKNIRILVSRAYGQNEINEQATRKALENAKKIADGSKDRKERNEALQTIRRSIVDMKLLSKIHHKRSS